MEEIKQHFLRITDPSGKRYIWGLSIGSIALVAHEFLYRYIQASPVLFVLITSIAVATMRCGYAGGIINIFLFLPSLAHYGPLVITIYAVSVAIIVTTGGRLYSQSVHHHLVLLQKALSSLQTRDDFLSAASHELKTPLTSLQLQLQLLRRNSASETIQLQIDRSLGQVDRLHELIETLVDVTQIQNRKMRLRPEHQNLNEIVQDSIEQLKSLTSSHGCAVSFNTTGEALGVWDRRRIEKIVTHLVRNAVLHGRHKPIDIRTESDDEDFILTVADQGSGIERTDQNRIFERFSKVTSKGFGGLGLGLYVTKAMVEAHGGTIKVKSMPGKGSTFTVVLPREMRC